MHLTFKIYCIHPGITICSACLMIFTIPLTSFPPGKLHHSWLWSLQSASWRCSSFLLRWLQEDQNTGERERERREEFHWTEPSTGYERGESMGRARNFSWPSDLTGKAGLLQTNEQARSCDQEKLPSLSMLYSGSRASSPLLEEFPHKDDPLLVSVFYCTPWSAAWVPECQTVPLLP